MRSQRRAARSTSRSGHGIPRSAPAAFGIYALAASAADMTRHARLIVLSQIILATPPPLPEDLGVAESFAGKAHRWIEREPIGVVGAITAWNFPHELNLKKCGWALAAGCTVVLKGAPQTPWCNLILGKLILTFGVLLGLPLFDLWLLSREDDEEEHP